LFESELTGLKNNYLREWQRNDTGLWDVADLTAECGYIRSDPRYFQEVYFKPIKRRDKAGNPVLNGANKTILDGLEGVFIEHIVARDESNNFFECKRQQWFSRDFSIDTNPKTETTQWQKSNLTKITTGGQYIDLTPSSPVKPFFFGFFFNNEFFGEFFGEKNTPQPQFFTPTDNDHLLVWSLPRLSSEQLTSKKDERIWVVEDLTEKGDLTTEGNGQTSAGNSSITVPSFLFDNSIYIFTRSKENHLLLGWQFSEQKPVDLTPTILGKPASYGDIFQTDVNQLLGLQYVFAQGSDVPFKDHLLAWRLRRAEKVAIPAKGFNYESRQQIAEGWNKTMLPGSGWEWEFLDLTTEAENGKTIVGDPTVYAIENADSLTLNVLAQGSNDPFNDHLLKWSLTVLSKSKEDDSFFNEKNKIWNIGVWGEPEDLTKEVDGKLIKGEPMTVLPPNSSLERIFVKGENNHLLEWGQFYNSRQEFFWQVTDLTTRCVATGEIPPPPSPCELYNPLCW
jgi:hypothetical protein